MSDKDYITFLKSIYNYGINEFMLANLYTGNDTWTLKLHAKEILKSILSNLKLRNRGQFWGYFRSLNEQIQLLSIAGFTNFKVGKHGNLNSYWIKAIR